jgi:hypothetical protein
MAVHEQRILPAGHAHVLLAGGDVDMVGKQDISVSGLADGERAFRIQALRKQAGEEGGDMLYDDDGRQRRGERKQDLADGFCAAGRGADGDEAGVLHRRKRPDPCIDIDRQIFHGCRERRCCGKCCGDRPSVRDAQPCRASRWMMRQGAAWPR